MDTIKSVMLYTLKQHLRHKIFLSILIFGVILIMGALLVSSLSTSRTRMITNLGLSSIELLSLVIAIFTMSTLILEEMESRTIYLILTHPIKRWEYLFGRFAGTLLAVGLAVLVMMLMHLAVLFLSGGSVSTSYVLSIICSFGKIITMSSMTLLVSLLTTSSVSSMSFSIMFWILGHFSEELKFLGEKSANYLIKSVVIFAYYLVPNFSHYNYRDFSSSPAAPPAEWFAWMAVYTAAYTLICLFISNFIFSQKEF